MHFAIPYFPSRLIILGELVHVHTLTSVLLPFMRGHLIICWLSLISQKTIHYTHISTNPYHRRDSIERIGSCSSGDLWLINNSERALLLPLINWNFLILLKLFVIEILREHLWIYALLEHFWFLTADLRQEPHVLLKLFFWLCATRDWVILTITVEVQYILNRID